MYDNDLANFSHEYYRPHSELENWLYEEQFDFHIEVHFLMNPIDFPERF